MDSSILSGLNAYKNQIKMMEGADNSAQPDQTGQASFAQMLEKAVGSAADTEYKAEAVQMQSLTGKVDLTDLVTAVTNAELTLNTVVAVRDRVINAYQDIIKMSI